MFGSGEIVINSGCWQRDRDRGYRGIRSMILMCGIIIENAGDWRHLHLISIPGGIGLTLSLIILSVWRHRLWKYFLAIFPLLSEYSEFGIWFTCRLSQNEDPVASFGAILYRHILGTPWPQQCLQCRPYIYIRCVQSQTLLRRVVEVNSAKPSRVHMRQSYRHFGLPCPDHIPDLREDTYPNWVSYNRSERRIRHERKTKCIGCLRTKTPVVTLGRDGDWSTFYYEQISIGTRALKIGILNVGVFTRKSQRTSLRWQFWSLVHFHLNPMLSNITESSCKLKHCIIIYNVIIV